MAMVNLLRSTSVPAVFISSSGTTSGTLSASIAPTGYQAGDLVIAFAAMLDTGDVTTMPSGWTLEKYDLNTDGRFGDSRSRAWSRVLSSADVSSSTWLGPWSVRRANGTGTTWTLACVHYRGPASVAAASTVYGVSDGTSTTFDAPSMTGPGMLVAAYQLDDIPSGSAPATMTSRVSNNGASGFTAQRIYDETVVGGSTGIRSLGRTVSRAGVAVALLLT